MSTTINTHDKQGLEIPVPEAHPLTNAESGQDAVALDLGSCEACGKPFKGKSGLSQHQRAMHPAEYHERNLPLPRTQVTWTTERLADVARVECQLEVEGVRNMNMELLKHFPMLTIDQIKGQRKNEKYRVLVQQYRDTGRPKALTQPMVWENVGDEKL